MKRVFEDQPELLFSHGNTCASILGPTASGKTALALQLARQMQSKPLLVSVDSVAAYQDLDIGSAKPRGSDRTDFDWIGLDLFSPQERINLGEFWNRVMPEVRLALEGGRRVLFVGGSHFYERALADGMGIGEASDTQFLQSLEQFSPEELWNRLRSCDFDWAESLSPADRYRVCRALDLCERQKISFSDFSVQKRHLLPASQTLVTTICHAPDERSELEGRLRDRIEAFFKLGWAEEASSLIRRYGENAPALESVGYRDLKNSSLLGVALDSDATRENVLLSHLQLVKKQRTWLRGLRARTHALD